MQKLHRSNKWRVYSLMYKSYILCELFKQNQMR